MLPHVKHAPDVHLQMTRISLAQLRHCYSREIRINLMTQIKYIEDMERSPRKITYRCSFSHRAAQPALRTSNMYEVGRLRGLWGKKLITNFLHRCRRCHVIGAP